VIKQSIRTSLASITKEQWETHNNNMFMQHLLRADPDLWLIKEYLERYHINAALLPPILEAMDVVNKTTGWGRVVIEIRNNVVVRCRGENDRLLELELKREGE